MNPILNLAIKVLLGMLGEFVRDIVQQLKDRKLVDNVARRAKIHVATLAKMDVPNSRKLELAVELAKEDARQLGAELSDNLAEIIVVTAWGAVKKAVKKELGLD